jgi:hypothetical protein
MEEQRGLLQGQGHQPAAYHNGGGRKRQMPVYVIIAATVVLLVVALYGFYSIFWAPVYDMEVVQGQLHLSVAAYCDDYANRSWPSVKVVLPLEQSGEVHGFVAHVIHGGRSTAAVVFRGSVEWTDWVRDVDVGMSDYDRCTGCRVHSGFLKASQTLLPQVQTKMQHIIAAYPVQRLWVTGHSLGGGVAALTALALQRAIPSIAIDCVTFGSPRVGNKQFAAFMQDKLPRAVRVTHERDIVPQLPLHSWGFEHYKTELWQHDGNELKVCDGGEDPSCSAQFPWYSCSLDDHAEYLGMAMSCDSVR